MIFNTPNSNRCITQLAFAIFYVKMDLDYAIKNVKSKIKNSKIKNSRIPACECEFEKSENRFPRRDSPPRIYERREFS